MSDSDVTTTPDPIGNTPVVDDFAARAAAALAQPFVPLDEQAPSTLDPRRPVTFDEVMSSDLMMQRRRLPFPPSPEWMPQLNTVFSVEVESVLRDVPPGREPARRRMAVIEALRITGEQLAASGYIPPPSITVHPDRVEWPAGYSVQRVAESIALELPILDRQHEADMAHFGRDQFKALLGAHPDLSNVGYLWTEQEVADLLWLDPVTLRNWRSHRRHLEYVKGPGTKGFILYTERGLRAFIAKNLHSPDGMVPA